MADDPEFARQRFVVDTDGAPGPKAVTAALEPAKVLTGRITYADTGKPVPHAVVEIYAYKRPQGGPGYTSHYETDDQGNYRANPISGVRYTMLAYVPQGQPYLNASSGDFPFAWPKGKLEHRVDLALRRGTVLRGKVIEEGTGRPVAGAALRYDGRPERGGRVRLLERHHADGPGRLVPARRPAQPGHPGRPGPQRGLRAPGDRAADARRGQAGRGSHVRPRLRPLRPQARQPTAGRSTSCSAGARR